MWAAPAVLVARGQSPPAGLTRLTSRRVLDFFPQGVLWPWSREKGCLPTPPFSFLCGPSSQLDVLTHRFITLLADTSDSRASENRVADANMACRKLAVAHPLLLLRYCRPRRGPHGTQLEAERPLTPS